MISSLSYFIRLKELRLEKSSSLDANVELEPSLSSNLHPMVSPLFNAFDCIQLFEERISTILPYSIIIFIFINPFRSLTWNYWNFETIIYEYNVFDNIFFYFYLCLSSCILTFQGSINCTRVIYFIKTKLLKSYHKRDFGEKKNEFIVYIFTMF